jgi:DNA-directed RNA polymerase subunit RPC12/RpoP
LTQRRSDSSFETTRLLGLETKVASLNVRISSLTGQVSSEIGDTESRLALIKENVGVAESTVNLTRGSSFAWKEGESPVVSVRAKDLNKDVEGILSFTNLRFIYETEKDVVLKKTLFIATQKKKVRETAIDKPVGMVDRVTKGRVGILAGQGLYITFKPESGLQEMKLDTKGNDTDLFIRFHDFISSGQADQELAKLKPEIKTEKNVPSICPRCGAPYMGEIFRGQTSMQCRYCGTTIPIAR